MPAPAASLPSTTPSASATPLPAASLPTSAKLVSVHTSPLVSLPTLAPPASQAPTPAPLASQASCQSYQYGPDPHNHLLYFDLVVPNAPTVGSDLVGSYHLSLVHVVEELYKVDNTISLFPYCKLDSNESLILKTGSSLGDSLSPAKQLL